MPVDQKEIGPDKVDANRDRTEEAFIKANEALAALYAKADSLRIWCRRATEDDVSSIQEHLKQLNITVTTETPSGNKTRR